MKRLLFTFLISFLFIVNNSLSGAAEPLSPEEQAYLKEHPVVMVGGEMDWAPFDFVDNNGEYKGIVSDYLQKITEHTGVQFKVVTGYDWLELLEMFKAGELDMLPVIFYSKAREEFVTFTKPYLELEQYFFVRDDNDNIYTIEDLFGKTLAVVEGYYTEDVIREKYPQVKLLPVENLTEGLNSLMTQKVDAFIESLAPASYAIEQNYLTGIKAVNRADFAPAHLYMGVNKGNLLLRDILQKGLDSISSEEQAAIRKKWVSMKPVRETARVVLTEDERDWLKQHPVFRFAGNPNWLPLEAFSEKGEYIGIVADYLEVIEKRLGIRFERVRTGDFDESITMVKEGKIDMISEVVESDLKNHVIFTKPYIDNPLVIVMEEKYHYVDDLYAIKDKQIAVIKGYGYLPKLHETYPDISFKYVDNIQEGLGAVSTGKVDAFVGTFILASHHISEMGLSNIKIVGKTMVVTELGLGIQKELAPLVGILNKALDSIDEPTRSEIFSRWIKQEYVEKVDYTLIWQIAGGALVLLLLFGYWNRKITAVNRKVEELNSTLEEKVKAKTAELQSLVSVFDKNVIASKSDENGIITYVSDAFCEISGYGRDELIGKPHNIIRHPDMPSETFKDLWETIKAGKIWHGEIKNRKKNGGFYWVDVTITPECGEAGGNSGYSAIRHDITDKKEVEALSEQQAVQMEEIARSNRLLSGRENRMIELKKKINVYALKVGETAPYKVVDEIEALEIESQTVLQQEEPDLEQLLDVNNLQVLMENFYNFMHIPLAIIDLEGNILVQSKWQRACTDFHRVNPESCQRCIESDIDLANRLQEGKPYSVYKCKNGLTDCASPIIAGGKHLANFFIGQFLIQKPDMVFFKEQANHFGYGETEYLEAIRDVPIVDETKLPHILGFLTEITKMVTSMTIQKLVAEQNGIESERRAEEMHKSQIASMNLAEDAERSRSEIENYKNHLEDLVQERTEELNHQSIFLNTIMDSQTSIVLSTNGVTINTANQSFLDFYDAYATLEDFKKEYDCICDTFVVEDISNGYLQKEMLGQTWIDFVIDHSEMVHKAKIIKKEREHIFVVTASKVDFEDEKLYTAVFNDITVLEEQKRQVDTILEHIVFPMIITNKKTRKIVYANPYAFDQYETSKEELVGNEIKVLYTNENERSNILKALGDKESLQNYETQFKTMRGNIFDALLSLITIPYDGEESFLGLVTDITEQKNKEREISELHKNTKSSIEYAALIQHALIPDNSLIRKYFSDYFAIWHPRDVVGGDIYLFEELRSDDEAVLMVIDCTGHGVPGAFVTMLVKAIERQIVGGLLGDDEEVSPAKILATFNRSMKHLLKQENEESVSNAGFDAGVLYFNKTENLVRYAGAEIPLYWVDDGKLNTIRGDRQSIGYKKSKADFVFTDHDLELKDGMRFYLTTDGYADQNGGGNGFPFGKSRFKKLLEANHAESMADQQEILLYEMQKFMHGYDKNDDVTVIGVQI